MKTRKHFFRVFAMSLVVLMLTFSVSAAPLSGPVVPAYFTYQGTLDDDGLPADGEYDFEFKLFDALTHGNQVGSTNTHEDVPVSSGQFTVLLGFAKNVFDGTPLYLEIGVRPGRSTDAFTTLTPRHELTPAPYAIYAEKAPWSGLTGVPAGFADGTDDGSAYQNVVVVAKSGGDFTTIQGALDSIGDAGDTNHYLVYIAPGVYDEKVTMKQYVDLQGSGELTTKITQAGSSSLSTDAGTLVGANDAEVRFLTVENTGGDSYAIAIHNFNASPRLIHVTASASNTGYAVSEGIFNENSSPMMTDVTTSASGATTNYGVNNSNSHPVMDNVSASASGSGGTKHGIYNLSSGMEMTNTTASASGSGTNHGITNNGSPVTINNCFISASGGTVNYGIYNFGSTGPYTVQVNNSQVSGTTAAIGTDGDYYVELIGASLLDGGVDSTTATCAGVYNGNYSFYAGPSCP